MIIWSGKTCRSLVRWRSLAMRRLSLRWESTVMSFGDGSQGAVGLTPGLQAYEPTVVPGLPPDVCNVAAGHYHSLAVTYSGQVWAWGRNSESQLGRGPLSPRDMWSKPRRVEGLDHVRIASAFASGVISAVIGEGGSLWTWGSSERGQLGFGKDIRKSVRPARVEALVGEVIVKVSFGWGHALALSDSGKLFGWGYYSDGRLGKIGKAFEVSPLDSVVDKIKSSTSHLNTSTAVVANKLVSEAMEKEKDMPIIWEPTLIEEVDNIRVVDIACGLDHSLVLCLDGTLLSGGSDAYGQLGRSKKDLGLHPVEMNLLATKIACGMGHSLAICDSEGKNNIVSWGWNQSGQLGRQGQEDVPKVINNSSLGGDKVVMISGGRAHSLAVTARKDVWSWGCGRDGRLGSCGSADEHEPVMVEFDNPENSKVLQAVAGFDHTLVLLGE